MLQEHSSRFDPASGGCAEPGKLVKELRLVGVQVGCVLGKSGENIGQIRKVPCSTTHFCMHISRRLPVASRMTWLLVRNEMSSLLEKGNRCISALNALVEVSDTVCHEERKPPAVGLPIAYQHRCEKL